MVYDSLQRRTTLTDPDLGTWQSTYDTAGNLRSQTDAKGQAIWFQYDTLNRLTNKGYGSDGHGDVLYTYDQTTLSGQATNGKGRLTTITDKVTDSTAARNFFYDAIGRLIRQDHQVGGTTYTTQATYDGADRVASLTYPNNLQVKYVYNGPWLSQVYEGTLPNPTVSYALAQSYTALGQPGTVTYGNGVVTTYSYSQASNPTCSAVNFQLCTLVTAKGSTTYQNLTYGYDAGGNITAITDTILGNQAFGYDGLDRLTSASGPYGSQTYAYSQLGNLTQNPLLGTYTYPGVASPSGRTLPHAVKNTGIGQSDFSYDNNGNATSGAGRTLTYDFENRPLTIAKGGITTTMVYDGDGNRVKQTVSTGGVTHAVTSVNDLYVCEAAGTSSACCVSYIFAGDQLVATKRTDTGVITYFHQDHLGSTSIVTANTAGAEQQEKLVYYPFGATRTNAGTPGVPFVDAPYKYTGQAYDSATGLYYYRARYYDPVVARFIQPDPIIPNSYDPQALNLYSYVLNNPLSYRDPSGLQAELLSDLALAGMVGSGQPVIIGSGDPETVTIQATIQTRPLVLQNEAPASSAAALVGLAFTSGLAIPSSSLAAVSAVLQQPVSQVVPQGATMTSTTTIGYTVYQLGAVVYNETASLSGAGIFEAREAIAFIVRNRRAAGMTGGVASSQLPLRELRAIRNAVPSSVLAYGQSVVAAAQALCQCVLDPTLGATEFNLRGSESLRPRRGVPVLLNFGPFTNRAPTIGNPGVPVPEQLPASGVYINIFGMPTP